MFAICLVWTYILLHVQSFDVLMLDLQKLVEYQENNSTIFELS